MKRTPFRIVLALLYLFVILFGCKPDISFKNTKAFYFPLESLKAGRVYEYQPAGKDSLAPEYWLYKSLETDSGLYFTGQYYDYTFVPRQFFKEEVVSNGTLMLDYQFLLADTAGHSTPLKADIIYPNVFPFQVKDTAGVFLFKIQWLGTEQPLTTTTLTRNRRYVGDRQHSFQGRQYDCVEFEVKELIEVEQEGVQEITYRGVERYAKGLGLVYYRKAISADFVLEYKLKDIYTVESLEQKYQLSLQQPLHTRW